MEKLPELKAGVLPMEQSKEQHSIFYPFSLTLEHTQQMDFSLMVTSRFPPFHAKGVAGEHWSHCIPGILTGYTRIFQATEAERKFLIKSPQLEVQGPDGPVLGPMLNQIDSLRTPNPRIRLVKTQKIIEFNLFRCGGDVSKNCFAHCEKPFAFVKCHLKAFGGY
ncbi:hypothetical protein DUI87_17622 [Hirundo rustica rustica]|uniref:Uncharacterized protein n=1 Tax=Hirundo rustica rustica TaxID=333673 RepID=A0A3M0KG42_HIRRU|nr:hypothetical protein DUI87_17622 [Hirundo rustica rustica]